MISEDSYISRSGQSWKIWLFLLFLLVGSVSMLIGFSPIANTQPNKFVSFVLGGSCLAIVGFIWLSVSVRCRACKSLLGWRAIKESSVDGWLIWLLKSDTCPVCKDKGVISDSKR